MAVQKTAVKEADKKVDLVLVGRGSQYIAGMGILRRGKKFSVSEAHAKKLLMAVNKATDKNLFMRYEDYLSQQELKANEVDGSGLDLGLVEKGTPKGGHVEIEEV